LHKQKDRLAAASQKFKFAQRMLLPLLPAPTKQTQRAGAFDPKRDLTQQADY